MYSLRTWALDPKVRCRSGVAGQQSAKPSGVGADIDSAARKFTTSTPAGELSYISKNLVEPVERWNWMTKHMILLEFFGSTKEPPHRNF